MLMLLFGLGTERYGIEAGRIREVVPSIPVRPVPHAPPFLAGLFNYRGMVLPVLDLLQLTEGRLCRDALSTRIMVVDCAPAEGPPRLIGLRAEKVTEAIHATEAGLRPPGVRVPEAAYLGKILEDGRGLIIQLHPERLTAEAALDEVLAVQEEDR